LEDALQKRRTLVMKELQPSLHGRICRALGRGVGPRPSGVVGHLQVKASV